MKRQLSILILLLGCLLALWANASMTASTASAVFANQKHILTPTSTPLKMPTPTATPTRNLDPRLDALNVMIEEANVAPGQPYWGVIEVIWHNEDEAGGRHSMYVDVLDESGDPLVGEPVKFFWNGGEGILLTQANDPNEYGTNFPMYASGNSYHVQVEELPSDVVHGMGLGSIECRDWNIHVEYLLKFQRAFGQAGTSTPTLTPTSTRTPTPIPDGLTLNEFMPRPVSDWNEDGKANRDNEYIELINLGNQPFDLTGLQLDNGECGSSPYTLSGILAPSQIIVFFRSQTGIALNDSGDEVRLLAADGTVLDEYSYSSAAQDQAWSRDDAGVWHDNWPPSPSSPTTLTATPTNTPFTIKSTLYLPLIFSSPSPPTTISFAGQIVETYTNCGVTQIFGVVHDAAGEPLPGTRVRLTWGGGPELYTTAGTYIGHETDASGWDLTLNTHPVANTWYVAIVDEADNLLSEDVPVRTDGTCNEGDANVIKVRFMAAP